MLRVNMYQMLAMMKSRRMENLHLQCKVPNHYMDSKAETLAFSANILRVPATRTFRTLVLFQHGNPSARNCFSVVIYQYDTLPLCKNYRKKTASTKA